MKRRGAAAVERRSGRDRRDSERRGRVPLLYPRMDEIRPWLAAALLAVLHVLLALLVFDPTPHTGGDNAAYLSLARSILETGSYVDYWDPLLPAHTQYPPVFPLVLALFLRVGLDSWIAAKAVIIGFSALAVAFTYLWVRRWHSAALALPVALLVALSPGVLNLSHWVLSDVPFWALLMIALWAFAVVDGTAPRELATAGAVEPDRLWRPFWIALAATTLAFFTRSAGLPLLVAAAGWLGWKRRWRAFATLIGVVGPLWAAWSLRRSRLGAEAGYADQFFMVNPYDPALGTIGAAEMVQRVAENAGKYIQIHLPVLLFGTAGPLLVLTAGLILLLAGFGWAVRLRRPGIAELFLPLYLGLLLLWPAVWSGERFLLPALPAIVAAAGGGLLVIARRVAAARTTLVGAAATMLLLLLMLGQLRTAIRTGFACTTRYLDGEPYACLAPPYRAFFELAEWTEHRLPAGTAVVARKPTLFYWLSGHRSTAVPKSREPAEFFRHAAESGSRYVVFDRLDALSTIYVAPALTAHAERFCVVHASPDQSAILFAIESTDPPPAPPAADAGNVSFRTCPLPGADG